MTGMIFVLSLIFFTIVIPIWLILHYVTRWRTTRSLSTEDSRLIEELWQTTHDFNDRLENIETILDTKTKSRRHQHEYV